MEDDVVRVLLNRVPPSSAALLNNFHRLSIKGGVYPATLPVENRHVTLLLAGCLLHPYITYEYSALLSV
ncbi:hypothetical protein V6N13_145089 [Hibiscus sabdariffa]|uniref:Uncharacterized protein n=2 Tax=Hibiscus sabdariffa TaxID=183260 RepID=A0ABR2FMA6_9ROSI